MIIVQQLVAVFSGLVVGILIMFLWQIARFYEKTSGERVGHNVVLGPSLLLAAGGVWYVVADSGFTGQIAGDLLLFVGGTLLCFFCARLQHMMTGERR